MCEATPARQDELPNSTGQRAEESCEQTLGNCESGHCDMKPSDSCERQTFSAEPHSISGNGFESLSSICQPQSDTTQQRAKTVSNSDQRLTSLQLELIERLFVGTDVASRHSLVVTNPLVAGALGRIRSAQMVKGT